MSSPKSRKKGNKKRRMSLIDSLKKINLSQLQLPKKHASTKTAKKSNANALKIDNKNHRMFDELVIAEKLLRSKSIVCEEATDAALDKIWFAFPPKNQTNHDRQITKINEENENENDSNQNIKKKQKLKSVNSSNSIASMRSTNSSSSSSDSSSLSWVVRKTPVISKYYNLGPILGHPGQYGVVKSAVEITTKEKYAVKILSKHRFRDKEIKKSFYRDIRVEVYLLTATCDHPNIVECRAVFEDIENVYVIMTCCGGGELFDRIQSDEGFSEQKASKLFRQMVSATYYVHSLGILHADLKPENFLFRSKKEDSALCLIDFGMAKIVHWRKYYKRMNGTPYYIAPEVLDGHYNESCDMWSLGVILFIMIFGFPPFFDSNESKNVREDSDNIIYQKIRRGFCPKVQSNYGAWFPSDHPVSSQCRDLMSRLLRTNVADRMTAEECLEHPWIKDAGSNMKEKCLVRVMTPTIIHSLQGYKQHCALQSEILKILRECNYLNSSQMMSVKDFFDAADANGDGRISAEELYDSLKTIDKEVTMEDAKSILQSLDANNDGYMDYDELLSSRINRKLQSKEARLRKVFKALDLDHSGKISPDELKAALESINETTTIPLEQCMKLIEDADTNNDGEIDFEEFITMFQSQSI